jgi:hypothetical protein
MPNTKISALPAASTPLAGTELVPVVQGGITEQVSVANLTAGRAVSAASLALTTTPLPATSGGTGQSSYAVGDLLYASTTTALSKLADVATGNALISGGVGVAPSWGKIGLTTHVSGTLAVGNGGTGLTTLAGGYIPYGNGASAIASTANFTYSATGWVSDSAMSINGNNSAAVVLTCGGAYSGAGIRVTSSAASAIFAIGADRTYTTSNSYYAATDNAYTLGTASFRWSVVYAATGTINTSDERYKQDIRDLSEAEKLTAQDIKKLLKAFRFKDSVQEKGDKARIHFGVIAQEIQAAFVKNGLNSENYGLFCYDKWEDEFETIYRTEVTVDADGNEKINHIDTGEKKQTQVAGDRFGIRYEELFAFVLACI